MLLYAGGDENNGDEGDGDNMDDGGDGDNMGGGGDGDNMGGGGDGDNMGSGGDGDNMGGDRPNFGGGMYIIEKVRRATSRTETAYPSGGPEFTLGF